MIVADAGPLIGLARVGLLELIRAVYGVVAVPRQVFEELQVSADRPGSHELRKARQEGWLRAIEMRSLPEEGALPSALDDGEAAAIVLAEQEGVALLIDERRGRAAARGRNVRVLGTGGLLLIAKQRGELASVRSALDLLAQAGYRIAPALRERLLELAGET